jgi:hypothetical protein
MAFPDYDQSLNRLCAWLERDAGLVNGRTLLQENAWPQGAGMPQAPDQLALLFETGGEWDIENARMVWNIHLVTRSATLREARLFVIKIVQKLLAAFKTAPCGSAALQRGDIEALDLVNLPSLLPRDANGRPCHLTVFRLVLRAPDEFGLET